MITYSMHRWKQLTILSFRDSFPKFMDFYVVSVLFSILAYTLDHLQPINNNNEKTLKTMDQINTSKKNSTPTTH